MIYLLNLLGVCIYYGRPAVYSTEKENFHCAHIQLAHFLFLHIFFCFYMVKYEQDGNETRVSRLYNNSGGVVMKKKMKVCLKGC